MIKKLTSFDQSFFDIDNKIQLVLKLRSKNDIPKVIDQIQKMCLPTRMKVENNSYMFIGEKVPIARLPDNLTDVEEASKWISEYLGPVPRNALGQIAANDNLVALSCTHSACDGAFMINMVNTIALDLDDVPENNALFNAADTFREEIKASTVYPEDTMVHRDVTRFMPKDRLFTRQTGYTHFERIKSRAQDLKCYDKKAGKPRGLTDALYANICLTCAAYEGKFDKIGLHTCVDMRKFINGKWGLEQGNLFSVVDVIAKDATLDTTIRDVMRQTREYFNQRINDGAQFGFFKHFLDPLDRSKVINTARPSISNLGVFKLGGPLTDMYIKDNLTVSPNDYIRSDFVHYGIICGDRNEVVTQFGYNPNLISKREGQLFLHSVHYGLKNLDLDTTCGEAMEKLMEYQQKFIKTEFPKYEYQYKY